MIDDVIAKIDRQRGDARFMVALAGAPASGKSTLAKALKIHYGQDAVILPMDGFHLDDQILGAKNLLDRKGAPETFDAEGFVEIIKRVSKGHKVYAPIFDRDHEFSRAGAIEIAQQKIVIVEGNYLLFDQAPWNALASFWQLAFFIDTPSEVIEGRCVKRWLDQGMSASMAKKRAQNNDLVNAKLVSDCLFSKDKIDFDILK